jgi:hypothetical protein
VTFDETTVSFHPPSTSTPTLALVERGMCPPDKDGLGVADDDETGVEGGDTEADADCSADAGSAGDEKGAWPKEKQTSGM